MVTDESLQCYDPTEILQTVHSLAATDSQFTCVCSSTPFFPFSLRVVSKRFLWPHRKKKWWIATDVETETEESKLSCSYPVMPLRKGTK